MVTYFSLMSFVKHMQNLKTSKNTAFEKRQQQQLQEQEQQEQRCY
jgi:hypothetical protein